MGFWASIPVLILLIQGLVYYRFVKYFKQKNFYKPFHKYIILIPFLLFNVSFLLVAFIFGRNFSPPDWFRYAGLYPFYIWEAATTFLGLIFLIALLIKLPFIIITFLLKLIKPLRRKIEAVKNKPAVQKADTSRRKFLRTAGVAVSAYAFAGAGYGLIRHDAYIIENKDIVINNLPQELKGLTVTLISDIHAGQYMTENDMREYADVLNDLKSDIICIPGDFINFNPDDINAFAKAFKDVKAKYGIFGTLGNHDYFVNPEYVANVLINESPVTLLRNNFNKISINGKEIIMLGVEDTRDAGGQTNKKILTYIDNTINKAKAVSPEYSSSPKILLCHKPYAFDDIATREVDVVFSGHTHGGQVIPVKIGDFNMSFAALISKYIDGLYTIGKTNMHVSRGIGTVGLPIRLNCPPEITKIKLV